MSQLADIFIEWTSDLQLIWLVNFKLQLSSSELIAQLFGHPKFKKKVNLKCEIDQKPCQVETQLETGTLMYLMSIV